MQSPARVVAALSTLVLAACASTGSDDGAGGGGHSGGAGGTGGSVASGGTWPGSGGTASGGAPGGGGGGTGGVPLQCDSRFSFSSGPPVQAGVPFVAKFTDTTGYTYVEMNVSGPGSPSASYKDVVQNGSNFTWRYDVAGQDAGVLSFEFRKDVTGGNPGSVLGTCQIESLGSGGSGGSGGTTGGGGGTGATGGSTGNFVPNCPSSCPSVSGNYVEVGTVGAVTDHPAAQHGDLNIKLRGWEPCTKVGCGATGSTIGFVYIQPDPGGTDTKAPKLHTLFNPASHPFAANFQMYDWDWSCGALGCKGNLISGLGWDVTAVTFSTTTGQVLSLPQSGYEIATGGLQARALYVDGDSVTLKYTGEDNVVVGYTLSIVGICPAPSLRSMYDADNAAGRSQLPALHAGDPIGTACGTQTFVTIRDSGTFMDPRSEGDWWQGHP